LALRYRYGPASVIRIVDVETPTQGDDEVLVRVVIDPVQLGGGQANVLAGELFRKPTEDQ